MYYTVNDIKSSALYTRREAAKILGISVSTLYRLRSRGMITPKFTDASPRPLYKGADLKRLFKAGPSKLRLQNDF